VRLDVLDWLQPRSRLYVLAQRAAANGILGCAKRAQNVHTPFGGTAVPLAPSVN